ncbi:MAG: UTP--glucose-1-phosphate uridylyltransferase GalU [Candidatus Komeilibacteria bacterium]
MSLITKAVIPVAGFGTRFLPATKAQPKEMLPLVDKPIIQYIVEEAVASGIKEIIFVTNQNKRAIEDHFDRNFELEYRLRQGNKKTLLKSISNMFKMAQFVYVRQPTPRGLADAIAQAQHLVGDDPFAVFLADDIIDGPIPAMKQMIKVFETYHKPVIGVTRVPRSQVSRYGIIDGQLLKTGVYQVKTIVEKPTVQQAPSNLAVSRGYIFTPEVFRYIRQTKTKAGEEIYLTNALNQLAKRNNLLACAYQGQYYDCGNKLDYVKAMVAYGLKHPEIKKPLKTWLKQHK